MTTQPDQGLRTTLHRLADSSEPLPVSDDLWQRGRAARRRGQALLVATALAIVVSVAGGVALLDRDDRDARTASTTDADVPYPGAIPSRIEDISPELEVTTDLAVGRASAAFISTSQRAPVAVSATDGVAHRLDLPGWHEDTQALALSPGGLRLAWQDTDAAGATISVLDLMTGEVWSTAVHTEDGLSLRELTWSPDSVWIAWLADTDGGTHVGRARPVHVPIDQSWFVPGNVADVAVSDNAELVMGKASGALFQIDDRGTAVRVSGAAGVGAGVFSPDGRLVALRTSFGASSATFDRRSGQVLEHPFPDGTFDRAVVLPLGWLDERLQLLQVWSDADAPAELVVTTPEVDETSTWRRSVGSIDATIAGRVSLAVDLVPDLDGTSTQELTHDFGDTSPARPLGIELSLFIGLGVAAAIALLMGLLMGFRRLRRRFLA